MDNCSACTTEYANIVNVTENIATENCTVDLCVSCTTDSQICVQCIDSYVLIQPDNVCASGSLPSTSSSSILVLILSMTIQKFWT